MASAPAAGGPDEQVKEEKEEDGSPPAELDALEESMGKKMCCSCHLFKDPDQGKVVRATCDFSGNKEQWRCNHCNNLKSRIQRIQAGTSHVEGWSDVQGDSRVKFMEKAAVLCRDDLKKAMSEAVVWTQINRRTMSFSAEGDYINVTDLEEKVKDTEEREGIRNNAPRIKCPISGKDKVWIPTYHAIQRSDTVHEEKRSFAAETENTIRAKSKAKAKARGKARAQPIGEQAVGDAAGEAQEEEQAPADHPTKRRRVSGKASETNATKEKPMKDITQQQKDRIQNVEGKLQEVSLNLNTMLCDAEQHKGTKVPHNKVAKVSELANKIEALEQEASDMVLAGKAPQGSAAAWFKDTKESISEANALIEKVNELLAD